MLRYEESLTEQELKVKTDYESFFFFFPHTCKFVMPECKVMQFNDVVRVIFVIPHPRWIIAIGANCIVLSFIPWVFYQVISISWSSSLIMSQRFCCIQDVVVGEACAGLRNQLDISYPVNNGIVQNWEDMGHVWDHAFFSELKVCPPIRFCQAAIFFFSAFIHYLTMNLYLLTNCSTTDRPKGMQDFTDRSTPKSLKKPWKNGLSFILIPFFGWILFLVLHRAASDFS